MVDRRRPIRAEFLPADDGAVLIVFRHCRQFLAPELPHGTLHPAEQVDAVGDVADGDLFLRRAGIKRLPHVAADLAVQFAHAVGGARHFEREHRHAKRFLQILRVHPAQAQKFGEGNGQLLPVQLEGVIHQALAEPVVAGLDRRVGGENALLLGGGQGVGQVLPGGHFFADQFQGEKGRVAFVHVEDRRLHAELAQQADAADAEQDFLHHPHRAVAAINARRQIAEMLGVVGMVGVQQIDRHAPDVHAPRLEEDPVHVDLHLQHQRLAVHVQHGFQRHGLRVHQIVKFGLPVVRVDGLLEITFAVEQPDADEAQAEVAGGLGVVAGENAQAAGGNGQRFVEAELGGEIRDGILEQRRRVQMAPGGFAWPDTPRN